jgi:transcriptional regulator with PAS, ATPase and Fis domain
MIQVNIVNTLVISLQILFKTNGCPLYSTVYVIACGTESFLKKKKHTQQQHLTQLLDAHQQQIYDVNNLVNTIIIQYSNMLTDRLTTSSVAGGSVSDLTSSTFWNGLQFYEK